jgi:alpha,alpha-trehalose phosphorylase
MEQKSGIKSLQAWQLVEDRFDNEVNPVQETLFALGNGYIGLRGSHEERFAGLSGNTFDETFINGFYESSPLYYPEGSYALAKVHQFMLSVPNAKGIRFSIDGEEFDLFQGKIEHYERSVDFRTGILRRQIEWCSPNGKRLSVTSSRLVSFPRKNLFAIEYEIKALNFSGTITVRSAIDGPVEKTEDEDKPRYGASVGSVGGVSLKLLKIDQNEDFSGFMHRTKNSGLTIVSATESQFIAKEAKAVQRELVSTEQRLEQVYKVKVEKEDSVCLTKYGAYFTSKEHPEDQLFALSRDALQKARKAGFATLSAEQANYLSDFWGHSDVEIEGNDTLQQGLHFSQFHLLQSTGRDGLTSVAAKGLTGEGYGGHYFWDSEIYALPFFLYTRPEIARRMLEYRYSILDKSRERAREMSHKKGALFAWRTINGEECSSYFPGGTAQYHINADIAYAIKQYYEATDDEEFITKYGAEIVMETARIWLGIGAYIDKKGGQFCINGVTGPDEYTAMVDNNYYTNAMAQMHLRFAAALASKLKAQHPGDFRRVAQAMNLTDDEPIQWMKAADAMYLPYDKELGVHAQDDSFLSKKKWNFAETPQDLPLHYHYLVIYRHQVCKQADFLMAAFLLGNQFTLDEKKRDYDYYEALTTHDSSLSHSTFSILASEVGYPEKAYAYFMKSARGDLDNLHGNTSYGVHIAAMAGTWQAVTFGFGGMRIYDGKLQFEPYVPKEWDKYEFKIYFKSKLLGVSVDKKEVCYSLLEGDELQFSHAGTTVKLNKTTPSKVMPIAADKARSVQMQSEPEPEKVR